MSWLFVHLGWMTHSDLGKLKLAVPDVVSIRKAHEPNLRHDTQAPVCHVTTNVLFEPTPKPSQFHPYRLTVEAGKGSSVLTPLRNFHTVSLSTCSFKVAARTLVLRLSRCWREDKLWNEQSTDQCEPGQTPTYGSGLYRKGVPEHPQ